MDVHFHIETPDKRVEPTICPSDRPLGQLLQDFVRNERMKIHPPNPEDWQFEDANTGETLHPGRTLQQNGVDAGHLLLLRRKVGAAGGGPVLVRCENGHYFDPKKHTKCPYCPAGFVFARAGSTPYPEPFNSEVTRPANFPGPPKKTPGGGDPITERVKLTADPGGIDPVVGWLIAVGGPDKGRDYRIRSENNAIGRSSEMDIAIASDEAISRERHAVITFDAQQNDFYLSRGEVRGAVYLNGQIVLTPQKLKAYDRILLGKTALLFVPFCGDNFKWE
jgi:hypothetical protein